MRNRTWTRVLGIAMGMALLFTLGCSVQTPTDSGRMVTAQYVTSPTTVVAPTPLDCASDGSPCSDPNNSNPQPPLCSNCCNGYHDCDGVACICGPSPN